MKKSKSIIPDRATDVRPLNQREKFTPTSLRKSIKRTNEVVNISWTEKEQLLPL